MKTLAKLIILALAASVLGACKSGPTFSDVTGKEWLLVEVKTETGDIVFDRTVLDSDGFGNIFTLNFDAERLSGTGAPNRYMAPYKVDKDQAISIQLVAGTLMAPIREPEKFKEQDYFTYLQNTYKWNLSTDQKDQIELYTKNADGKEAVLVYKLGTVKK
jgi:heat shock protein HslJ